MPRPDELDRWAESSTSDHRQKGVYRSASERNRCARFAKELEGRIEKLAHLHGEVAITTKNDGSAKKRCLRCGQKWPCDDLLILRGKTEPTYLEQLVDE